MSLKTNDDPDNTVANVKTVAEWMLSELERQNGVLYQTEAAPHIADLFGDRFIYDSDSGNACIDKGVLAAFQKLSGNSVVWIRRERLWRRREPGDELKRQQS